MTFFGTTSTGTAASWPGFYTPFGVTFFGTTSTGTAASWPGFYTPFGVTFFGTLQIINGKLNVIMSRFYTPFGVTFFGTSRHRSSTSRWIA